MKSITIFFLALISAIELRDNAVFCANILYVDSMTSPSINLWNFALAKALAARNHNVTYVTTSPKIKSSQNIHVIFLEKAYAALEDFDLSALSGSAFSITDSAFDWCSAACQGILDSQGLEEIIRYPDNFKFDLIFVDLVCNSCLFPLVHRFNYPPTIGLVGFNISPVRLTHIGGHYFPGYVSHFLYSFSTEMTFSERLKNTVIYIYEDFHRKYKHIPRIDKMLRQRFNFKDLPYLGELEKNATLLFVAADYTITPPIPKQPNEVFVGGMQIAIPKPLPEDLKNFIESGQKGTVLMCLGTNQRSDQLNKEMLINIIKTFESIPEYNFLWKYESDQLPIAQPKNVKTQKFIPQNDILAHPKVKAFITHSGSFGTQEALWYGKPCVAMPFFLDQYKNAEQLVKMGIAVQVDKDNLTFEDFRKAILTVLENPSYQKSANLISQRFQDQPERPIDRAVWWTEYILRNPKPDHLKSPILKIGFWISNSYDIIGFFLALVAIIILSVYKLVRFVLSQQGNRKSKDQKKKVH